MDITLEKLKEIVGALYIENHLLNLELAQLKERQNAKKVSYMDTAAETGDSHS